MGVMCYIFCCRFTGHLASTFCTKTSKVASKFFLPGIQTLVDARHSPISAKIPTKLVSEFVNYKKFGGDTPYRFVLPHLLNI